MLSVDSVTVAKQTGTAPAAMTDPATPAGPSVVKVTGTQGNWQLQVNGAPYEVKGLTYGPPQAAADGYMRDLKNMGVNTIRTWGVDDANTPPLLNRAAQQGIKVIVGHWLNQGADYVNDTAYKTATKTEIVNRVNALKNNPGVLMWDVGNEVILTMQDHGLSGGRGRGAPGRVRQVRQRGGAARSTPPTRTTRSPRPTPGPARGRTTSSTPRRWTCSRSTPTARSATSSRTGSPAATPSRTSSPRPARPASGRSRTTSTACPTEPTDLQKRAGYTASWNAIKGHPGVALGATEFHYGLENDFGGVWLNTFTGGWRRLGYYALRQAYTGRPRPNTPPEITCDDGRQRRPPCRPAARSPSTSAATDPHGDPIRYNLMFSDKHITGGTGLTNVVFTQTGTGTFTVTRAGDSSGVWKVYVYAFDGQGNVGIEQRSFKVVPPTIPARTSPWARPRPRRRTSRPAPTGRSCRRTRVDGNYGTRWASEWVDTAWIQVDLGAVQSFNQRPAGAGRRRTRRAYQIQTSERRQHLDDDLLDDVRQRRLRRPRRQRHRPLCAHERHGAGRPPTATRCGSSASTGNRPATRAGGLGRPPFRL